MGLLSGTQAPAPPPPLGHPFAHTIPSHTFLPSCAQSNLTHLEIRLKSLPHRLGGLDATWYLWQELACFIVLS